MSNLRAYKAKTVIAAQRQVLKLAGTVIRHTYPRKVDRTRLEAFDGGLFTIAEVLEHIDQARKLKVKP